MHHHASRTYAYPGPHDIQRTVLPNGIIVLVRENPISPAVVVSGYLEVGNQDEPLTHIGLANFVATAIERGTKSRSFNVLYELIESNAATFGVHAGTHLTSFGGRSLADSLPLLLDIIGDVLRRPSFEPEQVERVRAEILTDIREREHSTARMAGLVFGELAYPEAHPYHWSSIGYLDTVTRISRDDLVGFHEQYYTPQGMVLSIVGGVSGDQALLAVEDAFADWEDKRPPRSPLCPVPRIAERKERRVSVADKTQCNLMLGWPGPERLHPDFIPALVVNTLLGVFGLYGRLGKRIRQQNGLAYYAYSQIDGGMGPGPWRISAGVAPTNTDRVISLIQDELRRLRLEPVDECELGDTLSFLTGSLPLQLETNEGVARTLVNMERYALGLDYLYTYTEKLRAVTVDRVTAIAERWLDPDLFALAIAEPAPSHNEAPP